MLRRRDGRTSAKIIARGLPLSAILAFVILSTGCEINSWFDPSRTGRFTTAPTTMPILTRIDAIEPGGDLWGQTTGVTPEDLMPGNLSYTIVPGDTLQIEIYELYQRGAFFPFSRRVDPSGDVSIPEVGTLRAAGMTVKQFQDSLLAGLAKNHMPNPTASVDIVEAGSLTYTMYGHIGQPGRFTLQDPGLRLLDALAMAGGPPLSTDKIYVIRQVHLADEYKPHYEREMIAAPDSGRSTTQSTSSSAQPAVDIETLINQLNNNRSSSPAAWMPQDEPIVDIDDVLSPSVQKPQAVDVDDVNDEQVEIPDSDNAYIYIPERKEWVRVRSTATKQGKQAVANAAKQPLDLVLERVIEIPYKRLSHGDNSYNIVIRPGDQIYVDGPPVGIVYIDGEILRPGVYNLPATDELTLSRLIAAAGGLSALAIPERVDLVREVGEHREATIRLNLAAIRRRTEPDIYLKPNDHIIIGTNFLAYPLAILRNGLRANYGFAFLLDRNFGNDVFGAPPSNVGNR
ncbi:MAG: polysaccharide biosynthesis/export family protein [Phycisphaerales bacterium]|nr:polysaccharide biosynthesis/export family protein [Phycisphaerales bacterium]